MWARPPSGCTDTRRWWRPSAVPSHRRPACTRGTGFSDASEGSAGTKGNDTGAVPTTSVTAPLVHELFSLPSGAGQHPVRCVPYRRPRIAPLEVDHGRVPRPARHRPARTSGRPPDPSRWLERTRVGSRIAAHQRAAAEVDREGIPLHRRCHHQRCWFRPTFICRKHGSDLRRFPWSRGTEGEFDWNPERGPVQW